MFYPFLDLAACPVCRNGFVLLAPVEKPRRTAMRMSPPRRMGPPGAAVGPLPSVLVDAGVDPGTHVASLRRLLENAAAAPVHDERHTEFEVAEGVLLCIGCVRWFPIRGTLPELLPDHLRSRDEDREWLNRHLDTWPHAELKEIGRHLIENPPPPGQAAADEGARYKIAEMGITRRKLPESFWGPALVAPFYPQQPDFSLDLLARFTTTLQRLEPGIDALLLDICSGFAWTSEWLVRLGYRTVAVDLCRDYMLAGLPRMETFLPFLAVADVENLPLVAECVDGVFSFDSFHHIPDRRRAMREFDRVMYPGAAIAFTEPGKKHENVPASIAVMKEHGILERGFDGKDLADYMNGTSLGSIAHHRSDCHPHDIFIVRKSGGVGPFSRSPRKLLADLTAAPRSGFAEAGTSPKLKVTAINTGDTVWLAAPEDGRGAVKLGARLFTDKRELLLENFGLFALPHDVCPGESVSMNIRLPEIEKPGAYEVELDLAADLGAVTRVVSKAVDGRAKDFILPDSGLLWFRHQAFQPVYWRLVVAEKGTPAPPIETGDDGTGSAPRRPAAGRGIPGFAVLRRILGRIRRTVLPRRPGS